LVVWAETVRVRERRASVVRRVFIGVVLIRSL
jgi:hypothetical protein